MRQRHPSKRSVEERNALVLEHRCLPAWVYQQLRRRWGPVARLGYDDATQAGFLALIRAADLWQPQRGKFTTYAVTSIRRRMLQEATKPRLHCERLPSGEEVLERPAAEPLSAHECQRVRAAVAALPPELRVVVEGWVMQGRANRATGLAQGVSRQRVHQLRRAALADLRWRLQAWWTSETGAAG
jgi:RNA polymerase sigma factor (sigma-70 family)